MSETATLHGALAAAGVTLGADGAAPAIGGLAAECMALPDSVDAVRAVLDRARAAGACVVPVGRGTEPGCDPPVRSFVALATEGLAGIETYEPADLTLTARAGTPIETLVEASAAEGQWLPFDPPRLARRTFGGLLASGTSGPLSVSFGAVRDHVLGATLVTGDGRVLRLGGRVMKNVAGFDLVRAVVGSRGALGVIVSATVRLFPVPEADRVTVVRGSSAEDLLPLARRVRAARVVPASALLVASPRGCELVVRVLGAGAAVDVDEHVLLGGEGSTSAGAEARATRERAGDAAESGELLVRASGRPSELGTLLGALSDAFPDATLVADVMTGRVRAGLARAPEAGVLRSLRERLTARGGSLVLERAPAPLAREVGQPPTTPAAAIEDALRGSFDPHGTLRRGGVT